MSLEIYNYYYYYCEHFFMTSSSKEHEGMKINVVFVIMETTPCVTYVSSQFLSYSF